MSAGCECEFGWTCPACRERGGYRSSMTVPASNPRLVALLGGHFEAIDRVFSDDGNESWLICRKCDERIDSHMAHLAAEVEVYVQTRIALAKADAWDEGRAVERQYAAAVTAYLHWSGVASGPPVDPANPYRAAAHRSDEGES